MKFGYYRQDNSCHNYIIPEEEIEEFDRLNDYIQENSEAYEECEEFDARYRKYRVDGYIGECKVVLPEHLDWYGK